MNEEKKSNLLFFPTFRAPADNKWDAYGYCILTGRLAWLKRKHPTSPEIPHLEKRIPELEASLRSAGRLAE